MTTVSPTTSESFRTQVPARMDRLPWSRWHWLVIAALGVTWIIDGLEVTLIGSFGAVLEDPGTLHFTGSQIGLLGTAYLTGAVSGALVFGWLTDRLGRKKLFTVTLGLYLAAACATAFSWDFWSFAIFRFLTGAAIGGEYSAINSAIDELIPARVRGWTDLAVNGTFWLGAAAGSLASIVLLDRRLLDVNVGWRLGFGLGAALGLVVIFLRQHVPESPRWLLTHGEPEEAERVVDELEKEIEADPKVGQLPEVDEEMAIKPRGPIGFGELAGVMLRTYPGRTALGLALIVSQAFLYNGVFFTMPLVLANFFGVERDRVGLYLLPFAFSNFLGPVTLGRFFDTVGRKPMIAGTYTIAAVLLALTGWLFWIDVLTPGTQTALWALVFFFASSAASSAYLTVSEIFPIELRGMVIALFFATGTLVGGTLAPWLFGSLIDSRSRTNLFYGDLFAAVLLIATVGVVLVFGVKAEGASLESVARPLSAEEASTNSA
ncbi:MFS transporter [Paludisphaera rhizosphaerae]|uniref:MFS transporter n=1 Tax=Paludisphaera rhizosphaerae TaxID=2711216 RepID=UPI0013EBDB2D|nr:MFS transporter [Paludisphaera rhizosphaerae]